MKQMQLAGRFTCVRELKWPAVYMTDLPMGTTSFHQTFVSSLHIGYYHQLTQVCHPFNIFYLFRWTWAGSLAQQLLQCCLHHSVNSACELQSWYRHLGYGYDAHCRIHFLALPVHTLAHFLHEPSLLIRCLRNPADLLAWPWVMCPKKQSITMYTYTTIASPTVVTLDLPLQEWAIFSDQRLPHYTGKAKALLGLILVTRRYHSQLTTFTLHMNTTSVIHTLTSGQGNT